MLNILKKKQNFEKIGYSTIVLFFVIIAYNYEQPIQQKELVFDETLIITDSTFVEIEEVIPPKKDLYQFLDALAFKESSHRYSVQNRYGYMGKYQFGQSTLRGLGYNISRSEFINSPELQEKAMIDLLIHNREYLITYIDRWVGKKKNGVLITESGILAAAHLAGQGNVRNFFRYGRDFRDGNGTPLSYYLKKFGGYDLGFEDMEIDYMADIPQRMVTAHQNRVITR